jgi:methylated-DNA-protein-cysteine methyltransferase-like protein
MTRVVKPGWLDDVKRAVRAIPRGRVATYGDVAAALGARSVARQVGFALAALPADTDVPWHRVVNAKGRASPRADGIGDEIQRALLAAEGVTLDEDGKIEGFASLRVVPRLGATKRAARR